MAHIENNARISVSTLNEEIKKIVEPGITEHVLLAMLQKRGRITTGNKGIGPKWRTLFRQVDPTTGDDMETVTFSRINRHKECSLPVRKYIHGELISKYEKLVNEGAGDRIALFSIMDEMLKGMKRDFNDYFAVQLYQDGNASGSRAIHGLESWFGTTAGQITSSPAGTPSDTYAGLSTVLGNYGIGSWTGAAGVASQGWPTGDGDLEYYFFSPMVLNYTSTFWTAATKTWPNTWRECMRFAATYLKALHSKKIDFWLTTPELERQIRDTLDDKERIQVTDSTSDMVKLGFDTVKFENTEITSERGVPAGVCYGINLAGLELMSWQKQLYATDNQSEIDDSTTRFAMDFYGNLKCETPAFQVKLDDSY